MKISLQNNDRDTVIVLSIGTLSLASKSNVSNKKTTVSRI